MIAANMMKTDFASVGPETGVTEAARAMVRCAGLWVVPVLSPDGVLLGVLTPASLLRSAVCSGSGAPSLDGRTVEEFMERECARVAPDAPAAELATRLTGAPAVEGRALFVVDDAGRLLGVITPGVMVERLCGYLE